ncbi:hypothetical protein [Streptomyces chartreusis]|uniref:hypothetical protein n=1 Tax=Streptomyces chartreusis TaxID=1969 RepID=UPI003655E5E3
MTALQQPARAEGPPRPPALADAAARHGHRDETAPAPAERRGATADNGTDDSGKGQAP